MRRLALAFVALAALSTSVRFVRADEVETLRAGLLEGSNATWPGRMEAIGKRAEQVGAVVGPMLRDREPKHLSATAYAASWLADHPVAGRVLLDEEIVRRGGSDPAFVAEVRVALAQDGAGWARLVAIARGLVTGAVSDTALATQAAAFLRHESTASNVRDLLEVWEHGEGAALRSAASDSLAFILGAPFDDAASARAFLDADRGRTLLEWVRDLSAAKDRPDAPRFKRLLAEAAANLERVTTPEGLRPYLVRKTTPWPEVRRLAAARAKSIDPAAEGWTALFSESVDEETDVETLDALLQSFDGIKSFDTGSAAHLALRASQRLGEFPPPADGLSTGLLAVLGRLGTTDLLRGVATTMMDRKVSVAVLAAWLDAAASVRGLSLEIRALHRSRLGMADADSSELRLHALGALARGGAETEGEAAANGSYLASVLGSRADGAPRPEISEAASARIADERAAAARGLEAFPVKASVDALAARARDGGEDAALARLCASVLGRMAAKAARAPHDQPAVALEALIGVAHDAGVLAARVSAIDDLARLAADGFEEPDAATLVMRLALDPSGPLELRRAAARACAAAVDPLALPGVFALVAEDVSRATGALQPTDTSPNADWALGAAERLVRALASRDEASDDDMAHALRSLLDSGREGELVALALAMAAVDAGGGRAALQATRARLLLRASRAPGRTDDERISQLEEAHRPLAAILRGAGDGGAHAAVPPDVAALEREILTENLRRRAAQIRSGAEAAVAVADAIEFKRHVELEEALLSARAIDIAPRVLAAAIEADATLLAALRASSIREIRRAAFIDSARAELRVPGGAASATRARGHLASAKELEPTSGEQREIARIEAALPGAGPSGDQAPPAPR